jgi:hypothetical protein
MRLHIFLIIYSPKLAKSAKVNLEWAVVVGSHKQGLGDSIYLIISQYVIHILTHTRGWFGYQ